MVPTQMPDQTSWQDWSRPSLAVDVAVLTVRPTDVGPQLALLVLQRETKVYQGEWDIPGAFVHERERLSDAVRRALVEKAGISDLVPVELGVFDAPDRDPRGWVVSVAYTVAVPYSRLEPALTGGGAVGLAPVTTSSSRDERAPAGGGAVGMPSAAASSSRTEPALSDGAVGLAPITDSSSRTEAALTGGSAGGMAPISDSSSRSEATPIGMAAADRASVAGTAAPRVGIQLPDGQVQLPFDHQVMVDRAVSVLRERYEIRPEPAPVPEPDPDGLMINRPFTISELRAVYDTILGTKVQRDAFSRRFDPRSGGSSTVSPLRPTGEVSSRSGGRPASLHDFG